MNRFFSRIKRRLSMIFDLYLILSGKDETKKRDEILTEKARQEFLNRYQEHHNVLIFPKNDKMIEDNNRDISAN